MLDWVMEMVLALIEKGAHFPQSTCRYLTLKHRQLYIGRASLGAFRMNNCATFLCMAMSCISSAKSDV